MKWISRESPKIDRIACPWLIRNSVDTNARFTCVPEDYVFVKGKGIGCQAYDIPGADCTHEADLLPLPFFYT